MQIVKLIAIGITLAAFLTTHHPVSLWAQSPPEKIRVADQITDHPPQVSTTAEKRRPLSTGTKIVLGVLGAALIAGAVALGTGGGDKEGSKTDPPPEEEPGGVTVGW
jgi:hypothetical protein